MHVNKSRRADNFSRLLTKEAVHESIKAIIKYYGDCRKALKELTDRGIVVTEHALYHLKCGCHIEAVEEYMPIEEFRKLKERKIRYICEALVRHDGSVHEVYMELKDVIPGLNKVYIEKILYKEKRPDISNEYFEKDKYKTQEYYAPGTSNFTGKTGPNETWKPIVYRDVKKGMYEISSYGRIRNVNTGNMMSQVICPDNHIRCHLMSSDNNFRKTYHVHQLVATAFLPEPKPEEIVVNHMDLDPTNNHYTNLEWCTQGENTFHSCLLNFYIGNNHRNEINRRAMNMLYRGVPKSAVDEYAIKNNCDCTSPEGPCSDLFKIATDVVRPEIMDKWMFNDIVYCHGVYVFIYSESPIQYSSVFMIPNDMVEEFTAYEIRHMFNGRAVKVKFYKDFTAVVVINHPLDQPYWDDRYIEEYHNCKMITKDLPYEVSRYIELVVDKILKS